VGASFSLALVSRRVRSSRERGIGEVSVVKETSDLGVVWVVSGELKISLLAMQYEGQGKEFYW